MSGVTLSNTIKKYGDVQVIHGVNLEIEDGEFCVFVGPSGCGKSTLLRMVAGLEETTSGKILIGERDVTRADPSDRGVAMVFQTYALYPHMTVKENMGFGLKMNGRPKAEIKAKVAEATRILKLEDYLARKPAALSGGQRQRVAIGRAIVRGPEVFLFDEPLSNLDAELRVEMRVEISRLHKEIGATMIYVTHDQVEAMTLADKIVVLRDGPLCQGSCPRPGSTFLYFSGGRDRPDMGYSPERRSAVLKRMLPPNNMAIRQLAQEEGISAATLHKWRAQARGKGQLLPDADAGPEGWSSRDKFAAVLETAALNEADMAEYCRKRGLFPAQITAWRVACEQANDWDRASTARLGKATKEEKRRVKDLERELARKDRALAETAALLVLRKKASAIWGDGEDA